MKVYETFEHTADVGLRIYGKDLRQLFVHAAEGLFDLIAEPKRAVERGQIQRTKFQFKVEADSQEELLVAWLRELLYLSSIRQMFFTDFKIRQLNVGAPPAVPLQQIQAELFGEKINPKRHILKKEVKGVTYHALSLKKEKKGWVAEVIFDV